MANLDMQKSKDLDSRITHRLFTVYPGIPRDRELGQVEAGQNGRNSWYTYKYKLILFISIYKCITYND